MAVSPQSYAAHFRESRQQAPRCSHREQRQSPLLKWLLSLSVSKASLAEEAQLGFNAHHPCSHAWSKARHFRRSSWLCSKLSPHHCNYFQDSRGWDLGVLPRTGQSQLRCCQEGVITFTPSPFHFTNGMVRFKHYKSKRILQVNAGILGEHKRSSVS